MPVEMISGRPVAAAVRISSTSTISNEAIFSTGTSSASSCSTAASSNGVEKKCRPRSRA